MIRRNAGLYYRSQLTDEDRRPSEDPANDGLPGACTDPKAHIDPHAATWRRKNRFRNWWRGRPALGR